MNGTGAQVQESVGILDLEGVFSNAPEWVETTQELLTRFGFHMLAAILIFVVGRWLAGVIRKLLHKMLERTRVDDAIVGFADSLAYVAMMVFVVLAALGQLGVQTTSFIAMLGAAGLAVGLALQGSLSNFAAGVLILIFHPFKLGDYIEGGGTSGVVKEIYIFTTTLLTLDNKRVIIPNSKIMSDNITNYSVEGTRRLDLVACISYDDDIDNAKTLLAGLLAEDERVLKDPKPMIGVLAMNDSSIDIAVRPWVAAADYWDVYFGLTEAIKKGLEAGGCSIPYPQRDVHVYNHSQPSVATER